MKTMIYSYNNGSKGAKSLAQELGTNLIKHENSAFVGHKDRIVINWGSGYLPLEVRKCKVINSEEAVCRAINKIDTFHAFADKNVKTVQWTNNIVTARQWAKEGKTIICRTRVEGADGAGIVIARKPEEVVHAALYTVFQKTPDEYRITVLGDQVICRQKKVRIKGKENYNDEIRTTSGNYGFDIVELVPNVGIIPEARKAVAALGLHMGGVDVIADGRECWVLEVNTAPHLTPFAAKRLAAELIQQGYFVKD